MLFKLIVLIFPVSGHHMKTKKVKYPLNLEKLSFIQHKNTCFVNFRILMSSFDCYSIR